MSSQFGFPKNNVIPFPKKTMIPPQVIASFAVTYDMSDFPDDIDIDTAIDMVRTDLSDTHGSIMIDEWFLTDSRGKPLG
jgi:hypothetical protein